MYQTNLLVTCAADKGHMCAGAALKCDSPLTPSWCTEDMLQWLTPLANMGACRGMAMLGVAERPIFAAGLKELAARHAQRSLSPSLLRQVLQVGMSCATTMSVARGLTSFCQVCWTFAFAKRPFLVICWSTIRCYRAPLLGLPEHVQ